VNNGENRLALKSVLLLTQTMGKKAEDNQWDDLVDLEQQRQQLIETIFPLEPTDEESRSILEQIVELNNRLESLCRNAKTEVQEQLQGFNSNKKAMNAYQLS